MASKQTDAERRAEYWRRIVDAERRAEYWRELYEMTVAEEKRSKRTDRLIMAVCYTIYICCSVSAIVNLCSYDPTKPWDSTQRLLWCITLALNVGFGVFVAMSRMVAKIGKLKKKK